MILMRPMYEGLGAFLYRLEFISAVIACSNIEDNGVSFAMVCVFKHFFFLRGTNEIWCRGEGTTSLFLISGTGHSYILLKQLDKNTINTKHIGYSGMSCFIIR